MLCQFVPGMHQVFALASKVVAIVVRDYQRINPFNVIVAKNLKRYMCGRRTTVNDNFAIASLTRQLACHNDVA